MGDRPQGPGSAGRAWRRAGSSVAIATDSRFEMFYVGFEGPDNGERVLHIGYTISVFARSTGAEGVGVIAGTVGE